MAVVTVLFLMWIAVILINPVTPGRSHENFSTPQHWPAITPVPTHPSSKEQHEHKERPPQNPPPRGPPPLPHDDYEQEPEPEFPANVWMSAHIRPGPWRVAFIMLSIVFAINVIVTAILAILLCRHRQKSEAKRKKELQLTIREAVIDLYERPHANTYDQQSYRGLCFVDSAQRNSAYATAYATADDYAPKQLGRNHPLTRPSPVGSSRSNKNARTGKDCSKGNDRRASQRRSKRRGNNEYVGVKERTTKRSEPASLAFAPDGESVAGSSPPTAGGSPTSYKSFTGVASRRKRFESSRSDSSITEESLENQRDKSNAVAQYMEVLPETINTTTMDQ